MKYSEVDILHFIEGQFDDKKTAEFLAEQRNDPELAAAVATMQASQVPIDRAFKQQDYPPVPDSLRNQLELLASASHSTGSQVTNTEAESSVSSRATSASGSTVITNSSDQLESMQQPPGSLSDSKAQSRKPQRFMFAACLACGIGVGALLSQFYVSNNQSASPEPTAQIDAQIEQSKHHRLVERIADYQSLYVENTVATISDTRLDHANTLLDATADASKLNYVVPDFTSFGYEFARAQELGFEGQTLVQLVYRKPGTTPLALCFMPDDGAESVPMSLSEHHQLMAASWVADQHHYVLVAEESNDILKQLYNTASSAL